MAQGLPAVATGYDEAFLDVDLRMPEPLGPGPFTALPYPRFSVTLDSRRRFAAVTAVNIDGSSLQDLPRTGEWELDSRVPASDQAGPAIYVDNDLDRGHLVRRRDPGWGTPAQARKATEATFTYPNAAPQAAAFNQSKDLWVGLEDHVLQYADSTNQRVSAFTAPVLEETDPPYRGIRIPRRFWKVAAWTEGSTGDRPMLAAAGFVLDQSALIDLATSAVVRLGSFRTFQVPIADIAALADVDLGTLVEADVLPADVTLTGRWTELHSVSEIRLQP